ncbi:MAG: hypothetical protein PVJ66_00975 [Gammaproteobacteria bacterium]|jgi:hypothetical protein
MQRIAFIVMIVALTGCNTAQTRDVNSPYYKVPPGSSIVLNRDLAIPAGVAHIDLQDGTPSTSVGNYNVSCTFKVRNLGPSTIKADTFKIRETSIGQEWVSRPDTMRFYREFRLTSATQPDVMKFVCHDWDGPLTGKPVSVPEMGKVGGYVSFRFAQQPRHGS